MAITIKHTKTNNVADWTQTQLDTIIAGGAAPLPPPGTVLNDVTLPSDWNHDHTISGTIVQSVVAGTNITIDDTDPANPIINATGGTPGGVTNSVQTNNGSGSFGGDSGLIYASGLETLTVNALTNTVPTNKGSILQNTTVSTTGSRIQNSPPQYVNYHGWNSGTGAADWPISFVTYGTSATPGFGAPVGTLQYAASLNGGAYVNVFGIDTNGRITTGTGGILINGQFLVQGAGTFNSLVSFNGPATFFAATAVNNTLNVSGTLTASSIIDFASDLHAHDNNFYYDYVNQSLSVGGKDSSASLAISSTLASTTPDPFSVNATLQQVVGAPTSPAILGDPAGTFYTANGSSYTSVIYALDASSGTIGNASVTATYNDPNDGSKFQLDFGWSAPISQPNGISQYLIGLSINGGSFNYRLTGSSSTSFIDNDGSYPLTLASFVQTAGYTANGSTLGITYNLYNYQTFGSTTVFSSGNINSAVNDPNDGNDYIVNLGISTGIANWKIVRSDNKTGAFNGTSGSYVDQLTDPWSDSSVVTPTSYTKPAGKFTGGLVSDSYITASGSIGATATVSGLTFNEGLYISGSVAGSGVTSLTNSDGTLTLSASSGAVTVSLNTAHPNTWTGAQTINAALKLPGTNSTAIAINDNILFDDVSNSDLIAKDTVEDILGLHVPVYLATRRYDYFNDFINPVSATSQGGDSLLALGISGGTISAQPTDSPNRVGIVRSATGAVLTNRAGASSQASAVRFGGGTWAMEMYVNVTTLSTSTDRFQLLLGFQDVVTGVAQVDGAYFLYDEGGISTGSAATPNWQLVTCNNATRTFVTTSVAVGAATWVKLTVLVNAAGTLVTFLINGTSVGTISTNIPTASGRETGFGWLLQKSAGTTSRTFDIDYLYVQSIFTTSR